MSSLFPAPKPEDDLLFILPSWVRLPKISSSLYTRYRREILLFTTIRELEKDKLWIPMRRCQLDTFITLAEAFPQSFRILFKNNHAEDDMLDRHEEEVPDDDVSITTEDSAYMEIMFYYRFTKPFIPKRMQDGMFVNSITLLRMKSLRDAYDYLNEDLEDDDPPQKKIKVEEEKDNQDKEVEELYSTSQILTQPYNLLPTYIELSESDTN